MLSLSRTLCQDLDTPISLGVYLRQKYGEWNQYAAMAVDPMNYIDTSIGADRYQRDAQAVSFLKKWPALPIPFPGWFKCREDYLKERAEYDFVALEQQNARTNLRIPGEIWEIEELWLQDFVRSCRKRIKQVLGPVPDHIMPRFGKGSTFESKGCQVTHWNTVPDKITRLSSFTAAAHWFVSEIFGPPHKFTFLGKAMQRDKSPWIVRGSRFDSVEKDARKRRHINIEPGGNMLLQLGIGSHMRKRLQRIGLLMVPTINEYNLLTRGQESQLTHRALAQVSSICNGVATIDLSDASDRICLNLVKLLLPRDWFELLSSFRSAFTQVAGRWYWLEKSSSMGNGFTFELETLIFHTLVTVACHGSRVECYGDDLIIPAAHHREVTAVLSYLGLKVNTKKSFVTGPFRESCGGDYFMGFSVRPFSPDFDPKEPHEYITLANGLRRASLQWQRMGRSRFHRTWHRAVGNIPSAVRRCVGPATLGDLVIHTADWRNAHISRDDGIGQLRVWKPVPLKVPIERWGTETQLASILYGAVSTSNNRPAYAMHASFVGPIPRVRYEQYVTPRGEIEGYREGRVPYSI